MTDGNRFSQNHHEWWWLWLDAAARIEKSGRERESRRGDVNTLLGALSHNSNNTRYYWLPFKATCSMLSGWKR